MTTSLDLDEVQKMIRDTVREFSRDVLAPRAKEVDEKGVFAEQNFKDLAGLGLTGITVPEEYDGAGAHMLSLVLALEEIARHCGSTALSLLVHTTLGTMPILLHGTDEQKKKHVPPAARGEKVATWAPPERDASLDISAVTAEASRNGDGWKLNAEGMYVANASAASTLVVTARTGEKATSMFLLERGFKGITIEKKQRLGARGADTCAVTLKDVAVPAANLIGSEGKGWSQALEVLDGGRIGIAAIALGLAEGARDRAVRYAGERRQFGRLLREIEAVSFMLADMEAGIEAARHLVYHAARLRADGKPHRTEAATAKLIATGTARRICRFAIQVLGGYGYMTEYEVERFYRDAKITEIEMGMSDIQRTLIAKGMIGP
ncbi:MAG: acyl-CoA dehydrogenase family protein [Planctomycetota bacterium]|jgi:alkylation response protein AidB-like acyl-CoA dehydrogenase